MTNEDSARPYIDLNDNKITIGNHNLIGKLTLNAEIVVIRYTILEDADISIKADYVVLNANTIEGTKIRVEQPSFNLNLMDNRFDDYSSYGFLHIVTQMRDISTVSSMLNDGRVR